MFVFDGSVTKETKLCHASGHAKHQSPQAGKKQEAQFMNFRRMNIFQKQLFLFE